ncbi:MAG: uracil-DNA glycosylase [Elusimicrobia bacterium]|nr:uracil-DNA glycosylase [Elusimicrobiota bacterium]
MSPGPAPAPSDRAAALEALAARVQACRGCPLGSQRIQAVPGVGSAEARVIFIGEGPGFSEDHRGEPFVGRSGQLLDKILAAIGLSRRTVFIANVVKCHPMKDPSDPEARGNDRPPSPEEMAACRPYLDEQIRVISPRVLVTLGAVAARAILGGEIQITKIRGQWQSYLPQGAPTAIKLLPTFHPAALLRNPELKKDVWTDMKSLKQELELS